MFTNDEEDFFRMSISKFENMLKTNKICFFDSEEFENIILHYLDTGKINLSKKALKLGLDQHPNSPGLKLVQVELLVFENKLDKAEKLLRRAIMLLDKEPVEKPWPNWGRFDAHAWLGQILIKKRDYTGARMEYEKALAIAPKSGWITYVLMPELEKAVKTKP